MARQWRERHSQAGDRRVTGSNFRAPAGLAADALARLTIKQALDRVGAGFAAAEFEAAAQDARLLLLAASGLDWARLIAAPETPLSCEAAMTLAASAARRLAREPVSRILGVREFWGLDFVVTPAVLDPRPDTETVVEAALRAVAARRGDALKVLDLGTGSGALLAARLSELPAAVGVGVDVSPEAAAVAAGNLRRLGFGDRKSVV